MRKLSEINGEDAIDVIAQIIEPATEIMTDAEFRDIARKKNIPKAASIALKNHKRAVLQILAALDGEDPETYCPSLVSIPLKLIDLFNDPDLMSLFSSQDHPSETQSSGPVSANTEER